MLLLTWSCWEGLSAVALVSVQRKYSLWIIGAGFGFRFVFLGPLYEDLFLNLTRRVSCPKG